MHIVFEIIVAAVLLYLVLSFTSNRKPLPGPSLRDYLPGGIAHAVYSDHEALVRTFRKLSVKYGPVYRVRLGINSTIVTSVPEDILQILSSPALFPRGLPVLAAFKAFAPNGILSISGQLHHMVRKKLRHDFNYDMLKSFHVHMVDAVNELCDTLKSEVENSTGSAPVVDISQLLSVVTFRVITNVAFGSGMNLQDRLEFSDLVNQLVDELMLEFMQYPFRQAFSFLGTRRKLDRINQEINKACQKFIDARKNESAEDKEARSDDVLDAILSLDGLDGVNAVALVREFAVAGSHTTNQVLSWCMYEICCNPRVAQEIERVLDEHCGDRPLLEPLTMDDMKQLSYISHVWNEGLRLHSVGAGAIKRATADVTLKGSGTFVPKGTTLIPHQDRVQTKEEFWKDADMFKPERWIASDGSRKRHLPGTFLPFALGAQSCAGRFLADYEGPLILAEMYRRFKFSLGCDRDEVVSCTNFVESPRTASAPGGPLDRGLPLKVEVR